MDFAVASLQIWRRKLWLIPVILLAAAAYLAVAYRVSVNPPGLESRSLSYGFASSSVLVDSERSALASVELPVAALGERAAVYAELLASDGVLQRIGAEAGVPWRTISVDVSASNLPTEGPERGVELVGDTRSREILARVVTGQPIIDISTQAQSAREAIVLAQAASVALPDYINDLQADQEIEGPRRVTVTPVGRPSGGLVGESNNVMMGIFAAIAVFGIGCLAILFGPRLRHSFVRAEAEQHQLLATQGSEPTASGGTDAASPEDGSGNGHAPIGNLAKPAGSGLGARLRRGSGSSKDPSSPE